MGLVYSVFRFGCNVEVTENQGKEDITQQIAIEDKLLIQILHWDELYALRADDDEYLIQMQLERNLNVQNSSSKYRENRGCTSFMLMKR